MKALKTIFLFTALSFLAVSYVSAQAIQVGYVNESSEGTFSDNINGVQAGVSYELGVQAPVSLHYGLLYSYLFDNDGPLTSSAHKLDLPVHLAINFPIASNLALFVSGGPNFSYALAAKNKRGNIESNPYDNDNLERFNLQLGVAGGLKFSNLILQAGYDWGLFDLNKSDVIDLRKNTFSVSLAYEF